MSETVASSTTPARVIEVFYSYSHKDENLREELEKHLSAVRQLGLIKNWHDRRIPPGKEWAREIDKHLKTAHIILLLISADFLYSDYCSITEMQEALRRHESGEAVVIPILLRDVDLKGTPFSKLQGLPKDMRPVTNWPNRDRALANVARGIREAIEELHSKLFTDSSHSPDTGAMRSDERAASPSLWNIPYEQNQYFTGRENVLQALREALMKDKAATMPQIQAISGMGGIGKTQTAVEYAYRYRDNYKAVFWVRADTEVALRAGFVEIAMLLDLPEKDAQNPDDIVKAVRRWLESDGEWLLIFDNADEPELIKDFRPRNARGHIVLTSRAQVFDMLGNVKVRLIEMQAMQPEEAVTFLFKRIERNDKNTAERTAAEGLAKELGYLPLALEQSSAYIIAKKARFQDYLASYRKQRLLVLNKAKPKVGDYLESVATTWAINFREVGKEPVAVDLLRVSAFLSPDNIPFELIIEEASELGPGIANALAAAENDPLALNEALTPLMRYSLIRVDVDAWAYSIHRMVQEVAKDGMDAETQRLWAERIVRAVNKQFPDAFKVEMWPRCEVYLPHALICIAHIKRWDMVFDEATTLLYKAGYYLYQRAQYASAEPVWRQFLAICEQELGSQHLRTIDALDNLANLYADQGKYEQAEPLYKRALEACEQVVGPDQPRTARTLSNLASLYVDQRKYEQAELLLLRALSIRVRIQGEDHHHTASILNNLAELYHMQGKRVEAEPLYRRALAIREKVLGPDHPYTAASLNNLANLYADQGKYEQAEPLYKRALEACEQVVGPDHPLTLEVKKNYTDLQEKMK